MKASTLALAAAASSGAMAYTVTNVGFLMHKNIDPIIKPGQYTSHMHSFFGSDAVTINTTTSAELQKGCSTAVNPNDFSAYWVPTLYVKNETAANVSTEMIPVPVSRFSAYYKHIEHAEVPIPQNYRVASGNAFGKTAADVDPLNGIQWFCEYGADNEEDKDDAAFPARCSSSRLQQIILLPDCVNEDTLESAFSGVQNWNATYKAANRCPEGMKRMPQLRYSIRYNLESIYPDGWAEEIPLQLACGNSFCSHGDFINGWDPEAAENMAAAKQKPFIGVDGPFGKYNDGSVCKTKAKDADPEHGTGDYYTSLLSM